MSLSMAYNGLISSHLVLFGTGSDYHVLRFICERTLRFDKVRETIPVRHFETGIPGITLGLPFSRQEIHKARMRLKQRKLIEFDSRCDGRCEYRINLPAIWYAIKKIYQDVSVISGQIIDTLESECRKFGELIKPKFNKQGEAILMKIKQGISEGLGRSKKHREKRKQEPLRLSYVASYLRDLCDEYDVGYSAETWTKKLTGQARYFIKTDCKELGRDPREVLRDVVANWKSVRRKLKDDFGKQLIVPHQFTFSFFYRHRVRMLDAIRESKTFKSDYMKRYKITDHRTKP